MILSLAIETSILGEELTQAAAIGAGLVFLSSVTYVRYQLV